LYADFYKEKGDVKRARDILGVAVERFTGCGAEGRVERTEATLARL
jgi:hypothetical protein